MSFVTFGEIMLRLATPGFSRFIQAHQFQAVYGGGEANVAVSLAHLGLPAAHVTRFPDNELGKAATQALRQHGVDTSHIVYGGDRIGIYFLETGAASRPGRVIYDRANSAFSQLQPDMFDWETILADAQWFHWTGITPAISKTAARACYEAIKVANKKGIPVSADVNYRKNLWQYGKTAGEVMPLLVEGCDTLIASENDAADIFGIRSEVPAGSPSEPGPGSYESVCRQLKTRFPRLKRIVTTHRTVISSSHNVLSANLWNGDEMLSTVEYPINPIIDRIGGGDAFMAGLIYGLHTYGDDQRALDFGVAASVLKHTIEGDANLVSAAEVETLVKGENVGRLLR